MDSRAHNSIRAQARSAKRYTHLPGGGPATETPQTGTTDLLLRLNETRSMLAVATLALDEIADPHRTDVLETCGTGDVATVLRLGIALLGACQ
jgi:hypothetical protein